VDEDVIDIGSVSITAEADANHGKAIPLDLVFIYDTELEASIATKSASEWFKSKASIADGNEDLLSIASWQITPAETVAETPIDAPSGAVAAFLFANYNSTGDHRLRIDGSGTLMITLGANEPSVEVDQ